MGIAKKPGKFMRPLFSRLGPDFDSFARRGTMLIYQPVNRIIAGYHFDYHYKSKRSLHIFAQPLYINTNHLTIGWGWTLPKGKPAWTADIGGTPEVLAEIEAVMSEALDTVKSISTLEGYCDLLASPQSFMNSKVFRCQALVLTLILLDRMPEALSRLEAYLEEERFNNLVLYDRNSLQEPWYVAIMQRLYWIRDRLAQNEIAPLMQQISEWEEQTTEILNVKDLIGVAPKRR